MAQAIASDFSSQTSKPREADFCQSNQFDLFDCITTTHRSFSLCLSHDGTASILVKVSGRLVWSLKRGKLEQNVSSVSAHASDTYLHVVSSSRSASVFFSQGSFEGESTIIDVQPSEQLTRLACRSGSGGWRNGPFQINGTMRNIQSWDLDKIGLASKADKPTDWPTE